MMLDRRACAEHVWASAVCGHYKEMHLQVMLTWQPLLSDFDVGL
jgi:hypothetical protein